MPAPAGPVRAPNDQTSPAGQAPGGRPGLRAPWKPAADGRAVFRRGTPFVVWWIWVIVAVYTIIQVVVADHDYFSLELTAGLLAITGLVYACTWRPRVVADDETVRVSNPYREHRIGWGGLTSVYLGDSVELCCARPAPKKDKTIYCWALYSSRRGRMRSQLRTERHARMGTITRRAPTAAEQLVTQDPVQLMAAELGRRSTDAQELGAPAAVLESAWAWLPLALLLVPSAALLALVLAK
jgi:Bacterial PH domain